ncbi:MAG: hypothetical protein Q8L21_02825 [Candidatus Komeilibacteria bacterium]|nr:hypothetical protein [Candidatus Komeilibacteria bacterium]
MDIVIGWAFFVLGWCGNNCVRLFLVIGLLYYGLRYALEIQPVSAAALGHPNIQHGLHLALLVIFMALLVIPFAISIAN